jgi:hypothetical protein
MRAAMKKVSTVAEKQGNKFSEQDAENYNVHSYPHVLKTLAKFIEGTPQVHTFDVVTSTLKQHELVIA